MNPSLFAEHSERALLAAAVRDPDRQAYLQVQTIPADFTGAVRSKLREIIIRLAVQRVTVTFDLVEQQCIASEMPTAGLELDQARSIPGPDLNWDWHLNEVRSARVRRELINLSERLALAAETQQPEDELVGLAESISAVAGGFTDGEMGTFRGDSLTGDVKMDYFSGGTSFIDIGMGPAGSSFRGIRKGEVFTLLARTWVGKSIWASQAAINCQKPTLIFSKEMPRLQWWERTVSQVLGIPPRDAAGRLATGRISGEELQILSEVEKRTVVCDRFPGTIPSMDAAMKRAEAILGLPISLVVVDFLQLLRCNRARSATLYEQSSEAAKEMKEFAKRHDVAMILLSQVGRFQGGDGSMEVGLQSARDSGQIEEDADFLLGLWRPCMKQGLPIESVRDLEPVMKGRLVKNRRGRAFDWNFHFDRVSLRITPEKEAV